MTDIIAISSLWAITNLMMFLIVMILRRKQQDSYGRKDYVPLYIGMGIWEFLFTFLCLAVIIHSVN